MKRWTRATGTALCGFNRECVINSGDPVLVITLAGAHRRLIRCAAHAGEPVPATLDACDTVELSRLTIPDFASMAGLSRAYDGKARQMPAEDDER